MELDGGDDDARTIPRFSVAFNGMYLKNQLLQAHRSYKLKSEVGVGRRVIAWVQ